MADLSPAAKAVLDAYENWSNSMTDHPITPPPELVEKWEQEGMRLWQKDHYNSPGSPGFFVSTHLATQAARWGFDQRTVWDAEWLEVQLQRARDQELEACCEWVEREIGHGREWGAELRASRRPKPSSLAEEALAELEVLSNYAHELLSNYAHDLGCSESVIRRALERLQELEGSND